MATSLKLDDATKARVKLLAAARDRSPHWIMREAIREYVEREEKREAFARSAVEAWTSYRETGLHVTGEEAAGWLESWGTAGEGPPPACHG